MAKVAGYYAGRSVTLREILRNANTAEIDPLGALLSGDASYDGGNTGYEKEIRNGWIIGKITSGTYSGKFRPWTRTQVNDTGATAASFIVDNPYAFKVGDVITVGGDTGLTITAINYSTKSITVGSSFTFADNDVVFCQDGSGIPVAVTASFARLRNYDNTANEDAIVPVYAVAHFLKAMLLGDVDLLVALAQSGSGGYQVLPAMMRYKIFDESTGLYVM